MKIFITGHTGFIGSYFIKNNKNFQYFKYDKNNVDYNVDIFLHLAGKAHDINNTNTIDIYLKNNTELTNYIFDQFILSDASTFIFLSSVKASADSIETILTENDIPRPKGSYGVSKLLSEQYIMDKIKKYPNKRVYILRPSMVHGPGNKGNLNLMFKFVTFFKFWPLGAFENYRSYCGIDNLCFVIKKLIYSSSIKSGVYNISDDDSMSTNDLIKLIGITHKKKIYIIPVPKKIIYQICKLGDFLHLPFNTNRLIKLTENYVVSNKKIKTILGEELPLSALENFTNTFKSF